MSDHNKLDQAYSLPQSSTLDGKLSLHPQLVLSEGWPAHLLRIYGGLVSLAFNSQDSKSECQASPERQTNFTALNIVNLPKLSDNQNQFLKYLITSVAMESQHLIKLILDVYFEVSPNPSQLQHPAVLSLATPAPPICDWDWCQLAVLFHFILFFFLFFVFGVHDTSYSHLARKRKEKKKTPVKEFPTSDWPTGQSVEHFLG